MWQVRSLLFDQRRLRCDYMIFLTEYHRLTHRSPTFTYRALANATAVSQFTSWKSKLNLKLGLTRGEHLLPRVLTFSAFSQLT